MPVTELWGSGLEQPGRGDPTRHWPGRSVGAPPAPASSVGGTRQMEAGCWEGVPSIPYPTPGALPGPDSPRAPRRCQRSPGLPRGQDGRVLRLLGKQACQPAVEHLFEGQEWTAEAERGVSPGGGGSDPCRVPQAGDRAVGMGPPPTHLSLGRQSDVHPPPEAPGQGVPCPPPPAPLQTPPASPLLRPGRAPAAPGGRGGPRGSGQTWPGPCSRGDHTALPAWGPRGPRLQGCLALPWWQAPPRTHPLGTEAQRSAVSPAPRLAPHARGGGQDGWTPSGPGDTDSI